MLGVVRKLPAKIWKHIKVQMLPFAHLTREQILVIRPKRKEGIICLKLCGNGRVPLHTHTGVSWIECAISIY